MGTCTVSADYLDLSHDDIENEAMNHCDNYDRMRIADFIAGAEFARSYYQDLLHLLKMYKNDKQEE